MSKYTTGLIRVSNLTSGNITLSWLRKGSTLAEDAYSDMGIEDWERILFTRPQHRNAVRNSVDEGRLAIEEFPAVGNKVFQPLVVKAEVDSDGNATVFNSDYPLEGEYDLVDAWAIIETSEEYHTSDDITVKVGDDTAVTLEVDEAEDGDIVSASNIDRDVSEGLDSDDTITVASSAEHEDDGDGTVVYLKMIRVG